MKRYSEGWSKIMPFRSIGQGKRCKECARLDEERLQAISEEEKAQVTAAKQFHIEAVQADRAVNTRGNSISEIHASKPSPDGCDQLLKCTIDGMDQAKYRCPRNLAGLGDGKTKQTR